MSFSTAFPTWSSSSTEEAHTKSLPQSTTSSSSAVDYSYSAPSTDSGDAPRSVHPTAVHSDEWYNAILAGVVIAMILALLILAAVVLRYMYRHKGSYHTNEAKGTEHAETADAALRGDPALREAVDDSKKEYFI